MTFYLKGAFGAVGVVLSICWLLQILLYIFVYPPVTPFLNNLFIKLDSAFPLFGTVAFGIFCFYLIGAPHLLAQNVFSCSYLIGALHPSLLSRKSSSYLPSPNLNVVGCPQSSDGIHAPLFNKLSNCRACIQ